MAAPHSNNYKIDLILKMGSSSFSKVYTGTAKEALNAEEGIVNLAEGNLFTITAEKINGTGTGAVIENPVTWDTEIIMAFYSAKNQVWYERKVTVSRTGKSILINDGVKADYTRVNEAIAAIPEDLDIYMNKGVAAVEEAQAAVVKNLYESQQDDVDAMAEAIENAVAELKTIASVVKALDEQESIGLADKETVEEAQESLAELTDEQRDQISQEIGKPVDKIMDQAVTAVQEAQEQAENALELIKGLKPDAGVQDEQAVADAEAALEKLDDAQKAYVDEQLGESASDRVAAARKSVNAAKDKARKEAEANKAPAVGTKLTIGDASYTVTAGQTVSYNGPVKKTMKTASVPDTVTIKGKSYKVTAIAANAFKNNKKLKKLTVGVNIENIGAGAFSGCKAMKNMVIKTGVLNKVGKKAFYKTGSKKYSSLKIKVPKKMLKKYKKWFRSAKLSKKAKVRK